MAYVSEIEPVASTAQHNPNLIDFDFPADSDSVAVLLLQTLTLPRAVSSHAQDRLFSFESRADLAYRILRRATLGRCLAEKGCNSWSVRLNEL